MAAPLQLAHYLDNLMENILFRGLYIYSQLEQKSA